MGFIFRWLFKNNHKFLMGIQTQQKQKMNEELLV